MLRHTFCSHLANRGANTKAIQELAGHTDLRQTLRYMHISAGALRDAVGLLDRTVGQHLGSGDPPIAEPFRITPLLRWSRGGSNP